MDRGFLVYGDVNDLSSCGYVNTFKSVSTGYFSSGGSSPVRGEYKYLGFSINGAPQTNKYYPDDINTPITGFVIVPYSELSPYLKSRYAVPDSGNSVFERVRDLIDAPDSPVLDFTRLGGSQTLRDFIAQHSTSEHFSVFDNAIVYSWGNGEGSVRLFIHNPADPDDYRYATFTGNISPVWQRSFGSITCDVKTSDGKTTYTMGSNSDSLTVGYYIDATFADNYSSLSEAEKQFVFTRDDVKRYRLYFRDDQPQIRSTVNRADDVVIQGSVIYVTYYRNNLHTGNNNMKHNGKATVDFGDVSFSETNSISVNIIVQPKQTFTPTPKPTSTPKPTAIATPKPSSTPKPTATATPKPTSTPKPTATPTPKPTSTPKPTATATPKPTNTPKPTA
ncbi:MAG: hypothetical protein II748_07855, partial [Clostridia bacterium]|nr:hypothetical protein [Clostridia bacterium]